MITPCGLLALAAFVWLVVGAVLGMVGSFWLLEHGTATTWSAAPLALGIGWVKARWALTPIAERNARRLLDGPIRRSLTELYAPRVWVLAGAFMLVGVALRKSGIPKDLLGLIYLAVGIALVLGSRASYVARSERSGGA